MQPRVVLLLATAALAGCGAAADESDRPGPGKKDVNGSSDIAEELAASHEGSPMVDAALIHRYGRALSGLESRCREGRRRLGDFALYYVWQLESKKRVRVKPLDLLEGVRESVRRPRAPTRCRDMFWVAAVTLANASAD